MLILTMLLLSGLQNSSIYTYMWGLGYQPLRRHLAAASWLMAEAAGGMTQAGVTRTAPKPANYPLSMRQELMEWEDGSKRRMQ